MVCVDAVDNLAIDLDQADSAAAVYRNFFSAVGLRVLEIHSTSAIARENVFGHVLETAWAQVFDVKRLGPRMVEEPSTLVPQRVGVDANWQQGLCIHLKESKGWVDALMASYRARGVVDSNCFGVSI